MDWYVLHALSGHEKKVKRLLEQTIKKQNLEEYFGKIVVPTENVTRVKDGKRRKIEKVLYPGYILIQMVPNEETMQVVMTTSGITPLLGSKTKLHALSQEEAERTIARIEEKKPAEVKEVFLEKGESVKVIDGPFTDFTGVVEEIYPDREKLKVTITIFGRATPVELGFTQVQPI
jgi:transcriptional antiterminator NusG